jgi:hypothetical protein
VLDPQSQKTSFLVFWPIVKTTLELPDDLMRRIKMRAVQENRKLKDIIADLLQRGLAQEAGGPGTVERRVQLPLIETAHPASPDEEMTPDRVAAILLEEDQRGSAGP